jgi:hypothetical protein
MAQTDYAVSTTALSLTPSGTTITCANTNGASYAVSRTMVRTGLTAAELDATSQTWSLHYVVSATTGLCASRFRLQRRASDGVTIQSSSPYFTAHEPMATGTYDENVTWASGAWALNDQLVLSWETFRTSGTGNKTITIDANGSSYVLAPTVVGVTNTKSGWATAPIVAFGSRDETTHLRTSWGAAGTAAFSARGVLYGRSGWADATAVGYGAAGVVIGGITYIETGVGIIG